MSHLVNIDSAALPSESRKPSEIIRLALYHTFGRETGEGSIQTAMCFAVQNLYYRQLITTAEMYITTNSIADMVKSIYPGYPSRYLWNVLFRMGKIPSDLTDEEYILYARAHYEQFILDLQAQGK